jgi:hypothetical protein
MSNHPDTIIYSDWFDKSDYLENIPQPACILVDKPDIFSKNLPNIFIHVEPNIIAPHFEDYLLNNYSKYHTIFTFNETILARCSNAKLYFFGSCWIPKSYYSNIDKTKKQFRISNISGNKIINNSIGHLFRQKIHHNQHLLGAFPITFFRSSRQIPHINDYANNPFLENDSKISLFDTYQFSIVIENSKQKNYFTEKIIDCLVTKTIPIYWGCPNIDNIFDITGWIILESDSIEELVEKLKVLDEKYYDNHKDVVEKNYLKAQEYVLLRNNLNNAK